MSAHGSQGRQWPLILVLLLVLSAPVSAQTQNGTIAGVVRNSDGTPAVGVPVVAQPDSGNQVFTVILTPPRTDSAGRFRITNLAPGRYRVAAGLLEYSPTYYPGTTNASEATVLTLSPGTTTENINVRLTRPSLFRVSGRIRRPAGSGPDAPMVTKVGLHDANEFITLSHGGIARFLFEASVAPDGSFEFLRIPQGKYKLSTEPVLTSWIPFPFAVSDSDVMGLDLVVPLESRITVTVTVDDNIPLPPVTVSFAGVLGGREAQRPSAEVLTLPVRTYPNRTLYTALQAGEHRVVVSGFPSPYFVKSITAGARNLLKEPLLVEGIGPLEIVVTLALPPGNTVKVGGRVILPPGFSLTPSQTVSLYVPRSDTSLQAAINPDGTFEFAKVQRGEYEATLRDL